MGTTISLCEIKKALECCIRCGDCEGCPMQTTSEECIRNLFRESLNIINRQQDEIERLEEVHKSLEEAYKEQENYEDMIIKGAEVCARCHEEYDEKIKQAKAETIKEFAKAYKDQIKNYTGMFTDEGFYVSFDAVLSAVDFVLNKTLDEKVGDAE